MRKSAVPLHLELSAERSTERDIYFPLLTVSGCGYSRATWDFTEIPDAPLKVDRALRLLAAVPSAAAEIPAQLILRASVTARGLPGRIPLIGRQTRYIPLHHQA